MQPIVQISLDLTDIDEAVQAAEMALRAGVDWLESGTPLILAHGMHGVQVLRQRFPDVPIVADLKTMDGGWLEAEIMAKAGATHVVVMARAHEETIKQVIKAGRDFNVKVMGDNPACFRHGSSRRRNRQRQSGPARRWKRARPTTAAEAGGPRSYHVGDLRYN